MADAIKTLPENPTEEQLDYVATYRLLRSAGRCELSGEYLKPEDGVSLSYRRPLSEGGRREIENIRVVNIRHRDLLEQYGFDEARRRYRQSTFQETLSDAAASLANSNLSLPAEDSQPAMPVQDRLS